MGEESRLGRDREKKVGWDETVPEEVKGAWLQKLPLLKEVSISRCYFPKDAQVKCIQIHGFSDASENAYSGVVYFRMVDSDSSVHVLLVIAKTKVAPIKCQSIPHLELCGAHLLTRLVSHVKNLFHIAMSDVYMWKDSTIVLSWLSGNPRRLKTFVGNHVSFIMDHVSPDRWQHVSGLDNPADCASRGLLPSDLKNFNLWLGGPR